MINHLCGHHFQADPAARFIHNQILELAKLCLDKSRASQLTNAYFDEMANSLDKLLREAEEKCCRREQSVEALSKFIKRFVGLLYVQSICAR
jgi:hypothetical protein